MPSLEGDLGGDQQRCGAFVRQAISLFGDDVVAVAVFGSWARGQANSESDVDCLVVLEDRVALRRGLYRQWDRQTLRLDGRPFEPHFVHLPPEGTRPSGFWAEVALDGIVLAERDCRLSRWLVQVRRHLMAGHLRRRWSGGQPYWIEGDLDEERRPGGRLRTAS
jgi:predicted nucleotidyltransferase